MCSDEMIAGAMQLIAAHGGLCQLHCENGDVISWLEDRALAEGRVKPTDFPATCPDWTEEEAINRAILIGRMTNCPVYVVHLSTRLGLERIKQAQALGQRVYTETCPQYLLLTEDEMQQWGPLAKIGPPLRPAAGGDREALWAGLAQGPIAAVASDHSPRPKAMKEAGWKNIFQDEKGNVIPFGSPGLETLVPLVYTEGVVKRGFPLTWMARVLGENPARMFGLHPRKGSIRVGADADLLIWDPDRQGRDPRRRPPRHRRLDPLRRLEDHRPPLDDPPPRSNPPGKRPAPPKTRLRPIPPPRQPPAPITSAAH